MNNIERIIKDATNIIKNKVSDAQTLGELENLHINLLSQITQNCKQMCANGYTQKEADEIEEKLSIIIDKIVSSHRNWITNVMRNQFKFEFSF
jgi:hypothetical protein